MRDSAGEPIADAKGHALFASVEDGIAAWEEWMKRRIEKGQFTTAFQIMSLYAPPDDCVGSIGKPPNCPYGINPTLEYAERVASAVNKGANEELNLDGADARGREVLYAVFSAIATFEIGSDFCKSKCKISREMFDKAMDSVWGAVLNPSPLDAWGAAVPLATTTALTGTWVVNSEPSLEKRFSWCLFEKVSCNKPAVSCVTNRHISFKSNVIVFGQRWFVLSFRARRQR